MHSLAGNSQYAGALKEADRRKDEFLATLAHELRNPLAPIRNGLHILRMDPKGDKAHQVQDMMHRQLLHLVRLIDDLMDISRVSQGKIDLRKEKITIQSVLQSALEVSKPLINASRHHLRVTIPEISLWVHGDLTRLSQAVSNLLNNAAKYTEEGGKITLTVIYKEGHDVSVTVADNGYGIPEDMLGDIFNLFHQLDNRSATTKSGLGIGLALALRLIEMHDGKIHAESAGLGKGSAFTVSLPLLSIGDDGQLSETFKQEAVKSGRKLRILVVDDHIPAAQTTVWMLELIGHDLSLAHDGIEALSLAKKIKPDVIVMDIGLPGINGYDVCRTLRKDAVFKKTLMIAQTGWGQERDRQQAHEAGFDHHLVKPVDFKVFQEILGEYKGVEV